MATGNIPNRSVAVGGGCTRSVLNYSTGSGVTFLDFYRNKTDFIRFAFHSRAANAGRILVEDHYLDTDPDSPTYNTMVTATCWDRIIPA